MKLTDEQLRDGLASMSPITDDEVRQYLIEVFETDNPADVIGALEDNAYDALRSGQDWPLDLRAVQMYREGQRGEAYP